MARNYSRVKRKPTMQTLSRLSKQIFAVAIVAAMLAASLPSDVWAVLRVPVNIGKAPVGFNAAVAAGGVHGSDFLSMGRMNLGDQAVSLTGALKTSGVQTTAPSSPVETAAAVMRSGAAVSQAAALEALPVIERHPVLGIISELQSKGVNLNDGPRSSEDIAALREAIESNVPNGRAKRDMLAFAQSLSAPGGAGSAAIGRTFDGSVNGGGSSAIEPAVEAAKAAGLAAWLSRSWVPKFGFGGMLKRYVENNRRKTSTIDTGLLELKSGQMRYVPSPEALPESTQEVAPQPDRIIGQDRAMKSLEWGLRMKGRGHNVIVTGADGVGRETAVRQILSEIAPTKETPRDIVSASNFTNSDDPVILEFAPGSGKAFRAALKKTVATLKQVLPQQLSRGPYAEQKQKLHQAWEAKSEASQKAIHERFAQITDESGRIGLALLNMTDAEGNPTGEVAVALTIDGKAVQSADIKAVIEKAAADESIPADQKMTSAKITAFQTKKKAEVAEAMKEFQSMMARTHREHMAVHQQMDAIDQQVAGSVIQELAMSLVPLTEDQEMTAFRGRMLKRQQKFDGEVAKVRIRDNFGVEIQENNDGLTVTPLFRDPNPAEENPLIAGIKAQLGADARIAGLDGLGGPIPITGPESFEKLKAQFNQGDAMLIPAELTWEQVSEAASEAARQFVDPFNAMGRENQTDFESLPEPSAASRKAQHYLQAMVNQWLRHYDEFLPTEAPEGMDPMTAAMLQTQKKDPSELYRASVLSTNEPGSGAPVVFEHSPTFKRLFGIAEGGKQIMLMPGAGAVKQDTPGGPKLLSGSLIKANGGYLVLDLMDVLTQQGVYQALMGMLRTGKAQIGEEGIMSVLLDRGDVFEVPINVKIIFIGSSYLKMLLSQHDQDFGRLFKASAEFKRAIDISAGMLQGYVQFMANQIAARSDKLMHFTKGAISGMIEYAADQAESNEKLTASFGSLYNMMLEATSFAEAAGRKEVSGADVAEAVSERLERESAMMRGYQELYWKDVFHVDIEGSKVGQINALSVYGSFGMPGRTTVVAVNTGPPGVFQLDRDVGWSGESFKKGGVTITSFLFQTFGENEDTFPAHVRISKEQLYGGIDGDSSTSTQIYAALSALSGVPIRQGIALTGSADQFGNVQAIGGVNLKIKGYFDVVKKKLAAKGEVMTGEQGIMIPRSNVADLTLPQEIIDAVEAGTFHIWAVDNVRQGMEILTGESYAEVIAKGQKRLAKMRKKRKGGK